MVQWNHWHTEPALLIGILLVVWANLVLTGPLRGSLDSHAKFPKRECGYFIAGVITFYLAVGSPLDAMGEGFLFSAHMVQHNLLMYLVAPLSVLAIPGWFIDSLIQRWGWFRRIFRGMVHPLTAGFFFTFTFCIWHFPVLYEWALHNKIVHMVEHLTMYGTSIIAFWPILSCSKLAPRIPWGLQMLYIFLLMIAQIPLFGILTFSTEIIYPTYDLAPRISSLDPMSDQILGGLLMKVANMVVSLTLIGRAFYKWNQEQS